MSRPCIPNLQKRILINSTNVGENYESIMNTLSSVNSGRKFTRDEMNERGLIINE